ncbi:NtaA/DmoA family FMN-dependent monooxygenase [Salinibacterium sp. dk2585]|uniref:NtaA/DmoA family FMN-dependent monooxygenase n=1 Tax=unclassified Salinibacterium TaxID=2632331 RepID=UPI0011C24956|nr:MULTISPECIES: NtaA/DmoA family FMN-dependent monooxygenase [unclassified Salinibacterium]QEE62129.1 NtaA/DmoA family FMN-dependent monooxygenase [Salinibacterium sp. dk2585]TXK53481.1 NtaA/DmoA family FMN-dependent monooxygenase [Salinibacterium sp. dk5596]
MKKLRFGLFENAQANDSGTATWRHPENKRDHFDRLDYWLEIARMCEDAKLDFVFLADAWGWSEVNGQRPDVTVTESLDLPRLDPAIVAAALAASTSQLGLVITGSTLLEQPYAFARRMATLDHISKGRVGWNVVTTGTAETAAGAFGIPMVAHDDRYDMADDFMDLVYKLWEGSWEPDALERDKQGRFADPAKVHRITHEGPYFKSDGYGQTSYSPQGTPVLFQAGSSDRGVRFGGTHGEAIFLGGSSIEKMAEQVRGIRAEAVNQGRLPESIKIMSAFSCVIGATEEEAKAKHQAVLDAQDPAVAVASYAMFTGLDLSSYDPATPMTDLHTELSQTQISRFAGLTVGDVLKDWHEKGVRGTPFVGTAEQVADEMCMRAETADLDGFLLTPLVQPGSTRDFIDHVLPILRERGVAASEYEGETLRERLIGTAPTLGDDHPAARFRAARVTAS